MRSVDAEGRDAAATKLPSEIIILGHQPTQSVNFHNYISSVWRMGGLLTRLAGELLGGLANGLLGGLANGLLGGLANGLLGGLVDGRLADVCCAAR